MNRVAIVGVGLIGGSFGLALRRAGFTGEVIGVSSEASLAAGLRAGAITGTASLEEAAATADLIYLAQPVDGILATIPKLEKLARPGTLVTDVGSTKQAIVEEARRSLKSLTFLGGHPLAGKEQRGVQAAEAELFEGRPYVLTPEPERSKGSAEFENWLKQIGARPVFMSPEEHDATVAFTSHLPQMISSALALALARQHDPGVLEVSGPGLRDMTRLAGSSAELWSPILRTNKIAVTAALEVFRTALVDLQVSLENDSLGKLFEAASAWAARLRTSEAGT